MHHIRASEFFYEPATVIDRSYDIRVRTVALCPGLEISKISGRAGFQARTIDDCGHIHFNCLLGGALGAHLGQTMMSCAAGSCFETFAPNQACQLAVAEDFCDIQLRILPQLLEQLAADEFERFGLRPDRDVRMANHGSNPLAHEAASRLGVLLEEEAPSILLVYSYTLEFLAWQLKAPGSEAEPSRVFGRDRKLLLAARDRLLEDLSAPPTIDQLSREIGLNSLKLKRGFKSMFGLSVYALFQKERMSRARTLLKNCNVTETALTLGYSNISHFTAAFRKQFGVAPSEVRRDLMR